MSDVGHVTSHNADGIVCGIFFALGVLIGVLATLAVFGA